MILAITALDPVVQGIFWLIALILFILAAFGSYRTYPWYGGLVALGLAFFTFPWMWNAFAGA